MNSGLLEKYNRRLLDLPVECIVASPTQPRTDFDPEALDGLCESIKNIGIIQPLTVRYRGEGTYELIAGERRLRAAKRNEMRHVPCIIADVDDTSSALITLVENLQRMIKYIQQETDKKVAIIKKEAGKDADLEKEKIGKRMEKELEDYKTKMKIAQSQKMNKLRLEKLKVKIECVNTVFEEAKSQLVDKTKNNPEEYRSVLKNLMIQGFIKLLEENVNIICKKEDYNVV